ncbi:hypothetical protein M0R72_10260 [Candidatus Pacearchaeota archaeon]|jgi:hypothetical protein|nr:hypothetical protein [Candidatus Pacearchaeota archaeon]
MSNVVGSLVVNLSAHMADFDKGLKSASASARQFSREALANDIFKMKSGGGGGSGGGGSPLDPIVEDAKKLQPHLSKVQTLLQKIGRVAIGRGGARFASLGFNIGELSGAGAVVGGIVSALIGAVFVGKNFGDEIRKTRIEADRLGVSFKELSAQKGLVQFTAQATKNLAELSSGLEKTWYFTKYLAGELISWAMQSGKMSVGIGVITELPPMALPSDLANVEKTESILNEKSRKIGEAIEELANKWEVSVAKIGKSNLEKELLDDAKAVTDTVNTLRKLAFQDPKHAVLVGELIPKILAAGEKIKSSKIAENLKETREKIEKEQNDFAQTLREGYRNLSEIGVEIKPEKRVADNMREFMKKWVSENPIAAEGFDIPAEEKAIGVSEQAAKAKRELFEATKKTTDETEKLRDRLKSLTETPITKFAEVAKDLAAGFDKGIIGPDQRNAALKKARESAVSSLMSDLKYSPGAASMMQQGSLALFNAIADRSQGPSAELEEARRQTRLITEVRNKMPVVEGAAL